MALSVTWKQGLTLPHDPDDVGDIEIDFSAIIDVGDELASATVAGTNITAVLVSATAAGIVTFRLTDGTAGTQASVTTQITLDSGRKQSRTVNFNVLDR